MCCVKRGTLRSGEIGNNSAAQNSGQVRSKAVINAVELR